LCSHQQQVSLTISPTSQLALNISRLCYQSHPLRCKCWLTVVWFCISLMANNCQASFHVFHLTLAKRWKNYVLCLVTICVTFGKMSIQVPCQFFIWAVFLLLSCKKSLYVLILILCQICNLQKKFSHPVGGFSCF
jgi:hypothetical protein